MVPASRIERRIVTAAATDEDADDGQPLGVDDGVDVAGLGRQEERAVDRAVALDRHGDRDDQLAALGDPDDALRRAVERAATTSG